MFARRATKDTKYKTLCPLWLCGFFTRIASGEARCKEKKQITNFVR